MLQNGVDATTPRLDVASNAGFVFTGGTVLIDDEMIHYTSVEGQTLVMPWRLEENADTDGGMFRGRYGTAPAAHGTQSIVLPMPFRYWDRYVPRQDSGELSWYGFGLDVPGGFFHQLAFEKRRPSEYTDIEVLVRTDSRVPWFADPAATPGLFLFTDSSAQEPNLVNVAGDGFEVRVFFKYMSGAFDVTTMMANGWKSTPILESLRVSYLDQTRVLSREVSR
jgi:hypothetical protein